MIDANVELRRSKISSQLESYPDAYGFIVRHRYQGGTVVTIASRSSEESKMMRLAVRSVLHKDLADIKVDYEDVGFYFCGCRMKDDLESLGLSVVGSFPLDREGKIKIFDNWPSIVRNKRSGQFKIYGGPNEKLSTSSFIYIVSEIENVGYQEILEEDLYPDGFLLANGAVRSSEKGICQAATGEYITQTVCIACGKKTGLCHASDDFDELLHMKGTSDYCDDCAIKQLDCSACCNQCNCRKKGNPSNCNDFEIIDFDGDTDESLCSCPLGGYGE